MTVSRIFRAMIYASLLGMSFHSSWRREEGKEVILGGGDDGGGTYVFKNPIYFIIILAVYPVGVLVANGFLESFEIFGALSADIFLNITPYFLLLILFLPILRKHISAKACAVLWLLPIFMFYQPFELFRYSHIPVLTFCITDKVLKLFFYIWGIGVIAVLIWNCAGHIFFRRQLASKSKLVNDKFILDIWQEERNRGQYKREVELYYSENAKTPLSMGLFNHTRVVVLPERDFGEEELRFIFRHEICHLKHMDIEIKVLFMVYTALCWFNPLIWFAVRKANDDLELSCDELVLKECDEEERKQYASLLLQTAGDARGFTTCLSVDARALRYRLKNVVHKRKLLRGTTLLTIIFFCFCMSYGMAAFTTENRQAKDVLFENGKSLEISSVYYERSVEDNVIAEASGYDAKRMLDYISELDVEKYVGANDLSENERLVIGAETLNDYKKIYLSERLLSIECWEKPTEHYMIKSDMDWDYIMSCVEF